ncbi:molybdopterin molybdenumtransferase MoeA [Flavobacterium columnare NBRC 100251 = ATCC 23463]|uniref:Molybdopterin molybdenumtransferase n=1 Tax=Flavobacterium columnare (strain ATCC 49512 / CIP 103533 / TG 44/87) TaxID=1041826 RepID=G8XAY3_FLACA|nr:molybdopterin molybdotransferase MoeA [Flavobacterium columnare]AEW85255.1 molybdopterin biosynthesis protein MoeA [Flavobacterium columnare ATCC 49512]ANO48961.1 molybdopterin biosynthesis protein MoeA [Flavobacterium columnare]APT23031.1 molybdopterin molybdenumtransferase MoeA [Flavobacterium columnare]MBF6652616.1 molybdopterin molybdenumtransferase MoeA [Flavobacterium columnare]MBF6655296.1 molybdopterin molybdenumtransferase MoeA [Flavobacterium columnare]
MVSVQEALKKIEEIEVELFTKEILLKDSNGYVLASDIISPIDMPPFKQSAMDGFAVNKLDCLDFNIIGEIKAGDAIQLLLKESQAIKIFTGAAVPNDAIAVIPIEKCKIEKNRLILSELPKYEENIRPIGEQIRLGDIALQKGIPLTPAAIGFLSSLGIIHVTVYKKPSVGIVVTGNELIAPGNELAFGQIYESNSIMLQSALNDYTEDVSIYKVKDNLELTTIAIQKALLEHDMILISGGISVGDYDFVYKALADLKIKTLFYKVSQKPGKPLYVGLKDSKIVYALPGNPAASLSCYYIYVLPIIKKRMGLIPDTFKKVPISHDYIIKNTRTQFLKAYYDGERVTILSHQNSNMLNTFALANVLVRLEAGEYIVKSNSIVDIYHIN